MTNDYPFFLERLGAGRMIVILFVRVQYFINIWKEERKDVSSVYLPKLETNISCKGARCQCHKSRPKDSYPHCNDFILCDRATSCVET